MRANGVELATVFVSSTRLVGTLPASLLTAMTTLRNRRLHPAPGGGPTIPRALVVGNPVPYLGSFTPQTFGVGALAQVLWVYGDGFVPGSRVIVDTVPMETTYVSRGTC